MNWLIKRLRNHKDNRGMMANLRCILVDNKKHRAWPMLNRLGVRIDDNISAYVAGLFALYPEEASEGNFGSTCLAIQQQRNEHSDESKLTPTERRFQHLLSAEKGDELNGRLMRMVMMAKSQGVRVNYERLAIDLKYWNERTKTEWAAAFWAEVSSKDMAGDDV